jgi:L-threonylcarbamoyladenylate synthase
MKFKTHLCAATLKRGGVVAIPTDTIYGLSCLPDNVFAIQKLLDLKKRHHQKGLILLASDIKYLRKFVLDEALLKQIQFEKKPTTYLLTAKNGVEPLLLGGFKTVAIRLTNHNLIKDLCEITNSAIVSSSANIAGRSVAKTTLKLRFYFKDKLDCIIHPVTKKNCASRIVNIYTGEKIR